MRHHVAELLLVVFFVFSHVLGFVIFLQNTLNNSDAYKKKELLSTVSQGIRPNWFTVVIVGLLGALLGMTAFRYLHSKTKIDFYHSLPIKRRNMLLVIVANTILIFLVPVLMGIALECVICTVAGCFSIGFLKTAGMALALYLLCFVLCFLTESLAMILTGHLAVGFMGGCVFALYAPILLYGVIPTYASVFFQTYATEINARLFYIFSPLTISLGMIRGRNTFINRAASGGSYYGPDYFYVAAAVVWIVILLMLAQYLFRIRQSETAGKAMAFPRMKVPLRFLLVIPMSLFTGWGLYQMTLENSRLWLVAGIVLGGVLFHGLLEAIYQMDIRGLWSRRRQLGLTLIISCGITAMFWLDLFGYDSYLPKESQLESVVIEDGQLYSGFSGLSEQDEAIRGLEGEDMKTAFAFLSDVVKNKSYESNESNGYTDRLTVTWRLKNGKEKKRIYSIPVKKYSAEMDELYKMEEFKRTNCSLLYTVDNPGALQITCSVATENVPYGLNSKEISLQDTEGFLKEYTTDLTELSFSDVCNTIPAGSIEIYRRNPDNSDESPNYWSACYIYPSFARTLSWLKDNGYLEDSGMTGYSIRSLDVTRYDDNGEVYSIIITDKKLIDEVKHKLIPMELADVVSVSDNLLIWTDVTIDVDYIRGSDTWSNVMRTDKETAEKLLSYKEEKK